MRSFLSFRQTPKLQSLYLQSVRNSSRKLQKYPVPALHSTLEKYLKSVKPFLSPTELCLSETLIKEFDAPGGEGEKLQEKLHERAKSMDNWLEEWWVNTAYLEFREPVVVYSSPGLVFPPQKKFQSDKEFIEFAAKMVAGALNYKEMIDTNKIPEEKMGNIPLDMSQYNKVFGTCRLPGIPRDSMSYNPGSEHIIVAVNNGFYRLDVKCGGKWLKYNQIVPSFETIVKDACANPGPPVGILTSDNRDNWATAFAELKADSLNCRLLSEIEKSLFILCLDINESPFCKNPMTTTGLQLVHGGGPDYNSANRWYDKTIQFVINKDGGNGLTYEHTPAEGQPIAVMMDHLVNYMSEPPTGEATAGPEPKRLCFNVNGRVKQYMETAACNLKSLVEDTEFNCFSFNDYGKEEIKKFKLSPDSFLQMAMQYAFYRIHNTPGAHYESASTRMFVGGRTETIRSCSEESVRFAQAMLCNSVPTQSKANALRIAVQAHKDYTMAALYAQGVDRHLLGLKIIARQLGCGDLPPIFTDKAFTASSHMRISTSQVASACDGVMIFGPAVKDGYACCYNPRQKNINFGTSAFSCCPETSTVQFEQVLSICLNEMKATLTKSPEAKL